MRQMERVRPYGINIFEERDKMSFMNVLKCKGCHNIGNETII